MKPTLIAAACVLSGAVVFAQFPPKPPDPSTVISPPATNNLSVSITGGGGGGVTSVPPGIACPTPSCNSNFLTSVTVVLAAAPTPDSIFTGWSGACSGTGPCSVSMGSQRNVTATFIKPTLSYTKAGDGTGTVSSAPGGIDNCSGNCSKAFAPNAQVSLSATNGTGIFDGWGGNCGSTNPNNCSVTMTNHRNVSATFTRPLLKVSKTGTGTITATGINCGSDCQESFDRGATVTLTAAPGSDQFFAGWQGACSNAGTNLTCNVAMNAVEKNASAMFKSPFVKVMKDGSGASYGTVTSTPAGISCGTDCDQPYGLNSGVALTASVPAPPNDNARFTGWSGACTGSGACNITTTGEHVVTANFVRRFGLGVKVSGNGSVTAGQNAGISCSGSGGDCSERYDSGASVTLTAQVPTGGVFQGWQGACSGTSLTCTLSMTADRSAAAVFK